MPCRNAGSMVGKALFGTGKASTPMMGKSKEGLLMNSMQYNTVRHYATNNHHESSNQQTRRFPISILRFLLLIGATGATVLFTNGSDGDGMIVQVHAEEQEPTSASSSDKYYTMEEVAKHNTPENRVWVIFKDGVYDVTDFIEGHPGGTDKIMLAAGKSIEPFWAIYQQHHTKEVYEILSEYRIGSLDPKDVERLRELHQKQKDSNDIYANDPTELRHPALQVNMEKPFNAETPPAMLTDKFLTPNDIFFIRNHLPVPRLNAKDYVLEITGHGMEQPIKLTLEDLQQEEKFKQHTITVALQCAGNRRTEMSCYKPPRGLGWTNSAVGNAAWTGVKLVDILKHYGITEDQIVKDGKVQHVEFVGADTDGISTYATSIPADRAFSDRADVLLAFKMNGQDIPIDHGYPVRAIVPGSIGARNVKWLSKIILSETESQSVWQQKDYKTFSPSTDWDTADFSKAKAVHDAPVQSAITSPSPSFVVKDDTVLVKGYALSGSGNGIERVDLTTDGGDTWQSAELEQEPLKYNRNYGWTIFKGEVPVTEQAKSEGKMKICSKAVDTAYNVQPESVKSIWNIRGILNNTWHCINVSVQKEN